MLEFITKDKSNFNTNMDVPLQGFKNVSYMYFIKSSSLPLIDFIITLSHWWLYVRKADYHILKYHILSTLFVNNLLCMIEGLVILIAKCSNSQSAS